MDKNHCIFEIIDNAVDEFVAGYCKTIKFKVRGNTISVEDDGRGIPITPHKDPEFKGLSQAEVAFTTLHAGGKFGSEEDSYKTATGGLHGVGASCVNATSSDMTLTVYKDKKQYEIKFEKGIITQNIKEVGSAVKNGTKVEWILDDEIWTNEQYDFSKVVKRLKQIAYLNKNLNIEIDIETETEDIKESFCFSEGLVEYIKNLTDNKELILEDPIYIEDLKEDISMEIVLTYTKAFSSDIYTFVNNIYTENGGDHLTGFRMGLSKAVMDYAEDHSLVKDGEITTDDTREGITAIVNIKAKEPKFEGQGKTKIRMPDVRRVVRETVLNSVLEFLDKHPDESREIVNKAILASKTRNAVRRARDAARNVQSLIDNSSLPKLAACQSRNPEECEIYFVEGK